MILILILFVVVGTGLFLIPRKYVKINPYVIAMLQLMSLVYFLSHIKNIRNGENLEVFKEWIPLVGLNFSFVLDGLSLLFVILITGIGALVFIYARAYMKDYNGTVKFYFYLTLFTAAMLGLVLSTNFIQLFIFWELTSVLSFLLISFFNEKDSARKAAFQSLFVTGFGGLFMLVGIILIGSITGSYEFADWQNNSDLIKSDSKYLPALLFILAGVFTKSAQFPFHFWLPGAMQAPTPVSSYLHSATMVKAGVFLLARLNPVLGATVEWTYIIPMFGSITMLVGAYFALTQTDIKAILAYTTISALGTLVLLMGIDTKLSVKAALVFLYVHAFYKAALFMMAGYVDKKAGTRDIDKLGGMAYFIPLGFLVTLIAVFSMAGLPPMLGFIGKELIYEAKVQSPGIASLVLVMGVMANVLMVTISLFFLTRIFLGKYQTYITRFGLFNDLFLIGPGILAIFSLGMGLFPNILTTLVEPALSVVQAESIEIKLKLWHGFNEVLMLSIFTVLSGVVLFYIIHTKYNWLQQWRKINNKIFSIRLADVFARIVESFTAFSAKNTRIIQHGYHRYYLLTVLTVAMLLLGAQLYFTRGWKLDAALSWQPFYASVLLLFVVVATVFSTLSRSRLATVIAMGVVGYGISIIYLYYSAVDLAITQIVVETLSLVMFVIVLQKLPRFARLSKRKTRLRDAFIALSFGGVMTMLALKAIHVDLNHPVSDYFIENSYLEAFGKNVVNVILVDFRALDTLGEVTVLAIAALGVWVLLQPKKIKP